MILVKCLKVDALRFTNCIALNFNCASSKQTYYATVISNISAEGDMKKDKYFGDPLKKEMIAIINRNDPTNEMVMELLETFNRELRGTFPKNNDGRMDAIENATGVKGSDEGAVYIAKIIVKLNHNI